jgi:hypothetical protein
LVGVAVVRILCRVYSEVVTCPEVLSWALAGLVRTDIYRLVISHTTHIMSGLVISRVEGRASVEGLCHRTTPYLLVGQHRF